MENSSIINSSEAVVTSQTEPTRRQGLWSIVWGVVGLLLHPLIGMYSLFWIFGARDFNFIAFTWIFLISSVIASLVAMGMGLRERRTRLGCIGLVLGITSLVCITVYELCGGWFCLFWAP